MKLWHYLEFAYFSMPKQRFTQECYPVEAFLLDRMHEPLRESVQILVSAAAGG